MLLRCCLLHHVGVSLAYHAQPHKSETPTALVRQCLLQALVLCGQTQLFPVCVHSGSHKKPSFVHRNVTQWTNQQRYLHFPVQFSDLYYFYSIEKLLYAARDVTKEQLPTHLSAVPGPPEIVSDSTIFVTSYKLYMQLTRSIQNSVELFKVSCINCSPF